MVDKLIVTNRGPLRGKYGAGLAAIETAVGQLRDADRGRGLTTELVYLDDPDFATMTGSPPVSNASDPAENKAAIDAAFGHWSPHYLVLLGAPDVVPHQDLMNPRYNPPDMDDDSYAWSDLPYACDGPYSQRIEDFRGPSRVVGRIPDVVRAVHPGYVVARLQDAAKASPRPREDFQSYFGLTAEAWTTAGRANLITIFGDYTGLVTSPPKGPVWPAALLGAPAHVVSCHGARSSPWFSGDDGNGGIPQALHAQALAGRVAGGAVGTAECCYGAELYDPSTAAGELGICTSFLGQGGIAYFGSTTVAYANAIDVGWAGLITQFFWESILAGASSGRAALEARQRFVGSGQTDPAGLKTVAQFILLGDPSVQPVQTRPSPTRRSEMDESDDDRLLDSSLSARAARSARSGRRANLVDRGRFLEATIPFAGEATEEGRRADIVALGDQLGGEVSYLVHPVHDPPGFFQLRPSPVRRYHVVSTGRRLDNGVTLIRGMLAFEVDAQIVEIREFISR